MSGDSRRIEWLIFLIGLKMSKISNLDFSRISTFLEIDRVPCSLLVARLVELMHIEWA